MRNQRETTNNAINENNSFENIRGIRCRIPKTYRSLPLGTKPNLYPTPK